jgi:hypothetical protein
MRTQLHVAGRSLGRRLGAAFTGTDLLCVEIPDDQRNNTTGEPKINFFLSPDALSLVHVEELDVMCLESAFTIESLGRYQLYSCSLLLRVLAPRGSDRMHTREA